MQHAIAKANDSNAFPMIFDQKSSMGVKCLESMIVIRHKINIDSSIDYPNSQGLNQEFVETPAHCW